MKLRFRQLLFGTSLNDNKAVNTGWLLFRLHLGLSIAIHAGLPKMKDMAAPGWFNDQVAGLGFTFPSAAFWATLASWGEFVGGLCIALGLLTRFNALQLAFQFFVISFLWYDNPEPLTGMYFQQTLFWCFVLIAFGGSGRYSLDQLILKRKKLPASNLVKAAVTACLLLWVSGANAQASVSKNDFTILEGKWKGELTYLDYSSNKTETIKTNVAVSVKKGEKFELSFYYTDEPDENSKDRYTIREKGARINDMKVIERKPGEDSTLVVVLESKGTDGNDHKPATFRHVLVIGKNIFSMTKLVSFERSSYFQRNQYRFTR